MLVDIKGTLVVFEENLKVYLVPRLGSKENVDDKVDQVLLVALVAIKEQIILVVLVTIRIGVSFYQMVNENVKVIVATIEVIDKVELV